MIGRTRLELEFLVFWHDFQRQQKTNFIFGRFAPKAVSQQFHSTKGIKLTLDGTFQRLSCWDKRAQWALST